MSDELEQTPRMVIPRRWMLAGGAAALGTFAGRGLAQEGEGGEGGEGGGLGADDEVVDLMLGLGLIEGHLLAGAKLYAEGHPDMAATHMKHPGDEIYSDLLPLLREAGAEDFSDELEELAAAVEGGAGADAVAEAHAEVVKEIQEGREHAHASPGQVAKVIVQLVRNAADEYADGVVDGKLAELHEYQDAWGFVQVAKMQIGELAAAAPEQAAAMSAALEPADALFPGLVPGDVIDGEAGVLYGAAARLEIVGLKLD